MPYWLAGRSPEALLVSWERLGGLGVVGRPAQSAGRGREGWERWGEMGGLGRPFWREGKN